MLLACFGVVIGNIKQTTGQESGSSFQWLSKPIRQLLQRIVVFATVPSRGVTEIGVETDVECKALSLAGLHAALGGGLVQQEGVAASRAGVVLGWG
ncbi:hypothetical protein G3480_12480 [Thiorhodococcus mannitoliphagus]|uniref:Uncharacterized protein n=1 Tax=Thiorhodococcus mannitoliphagus TaxID=329406 RepID=A0A6P1DSP9_9GAMM|nr:hypothetical protein [Thiorhodococcus mannitoliphagus]NEX21118.1 hypothetical protein [Thiorhodococcus mannitoliphagus]